ncbi:carboxylesterase [Colletotrichum simmondsii]|uniref:Carboxylesterase n=1 Tax=Colletotrichum simmondsii TaxID=703756 RepID=A0A135T7L3_9PEZI|nr:carboxylesterase [Colletotrichum simmondsii]
MQDTTTSQTSNTPMHLGVCPAVFPAWYGMSTLYQSGQLSLDELNSTFAELQFLNPNSSSESINQYLSDTDTKTTEDCLALDVVVPERLWSKSRNNSHSAAPVLVWIHGGSYVLGHKNFASNPTGLIAYSQEDGSDGVVYVTLNYRLGLFGWMSGPDFKEQGGVANLGLRDQRLALEWIQENIHLFGGDPDNVTVLGESAGGGSILHQLTASNSSSSAPFKRAILQSPGFEPMEGPAKQNSQYKKVLEWASYFSNSTISSLDDLKQLPFDVLWKTNQIIIAKSYWGAWGPWGPAVDGDFVQDLPGVLLSKGDFDKSVEILTSHNSDEGFIFASPLIQTDDEYVSGLLRNLLPGAPDDIIDYLKTDLYPAVYDSTHPWKTPLERTSATIADVWFICNNQFLNEALGGNAYNYLFDVPPGYHGTDIAHTFFNGEASSNGLPLNASAAATLQGYMYFTFTSSEELLVSFPLFVTLNESPPACPLQLIFCGIISIWAPIWGFFAVPDNPHITRARWMRPGEQVKHITRMEAIDRRKPEPLTKARVLAIFTNWPIYVFSFALICHCVINLLPTAAQAVGLVTTLLYAWLSDGLGNRWQVLLIPATINLIGMIMVAVESSYALTFVGYVINAASWGFWPVLYAWAIEIMHKNMEERAIVIGVAQTLGQAFIAWVPVVILDVGKYAPSFHIGFSVMCGVSVLELSSIFIIKYFEKREKAKNEQSILGD